MHATTFAQYISHLKGLRGEASRCNSCKIAGTCLQPKMNLGHCLCPCAACAIANESLCGGWPPASSQSPQKELGSAGHRMLVRILLSSQPHSAVGIQSMHIGCPVLAPHLYHRTLICLELHRRPWILYSCAAPCTCRARALAALSWARTCFISALICLELHRRPCAGTRAQERCRRSAQCEGMGSCGIHQADDML